LTGSLRLAKMVGMATRRRGRPGLASLLPIDRQLAVVGDVRTAPITIREEGGRPYKPVLALWADAASGQIWGSAIGPAGAGATALVEAILTPGPPPYDVRGALPGRLIVFRPDLADELRSMLGDGIRVEVIAPLAEFDEMFSEFFAYLEETNRPTSRLPQEALTLLCRASEQLWRHKPWQYMDDEPAVAIRPQAPGFEERVASVLGAIDEVYGVALYASHADYQRFRKAGEPDRRRRPLEGEHAQPPGAGVTDRSARVLRALRRRAVLLSFDPKEDVHPQYRDQLAKAGWPRRLPMVPTFVALGGDTPPGELTPSEAEQTSLAVEALVSFCAAHEDEIAAGDFPVEGTVAVPFEGQDVVVTLSVPATATRRASKQRSSESA